MSHKLPWIRRPRPQLHPLGPNFRLWLAGAVGLFGVFSAGLTGLSHGKPLVGALAIGIGLAIVAGFGAYLARPIGQTAGKIRASRSRRRQT